VGSTGCSTEADPRHLTAAIEKGLRAEIADDLASIVDVACDAVLRPRERIDHSPVL
jgi:hypothetical protein